MDLNPYHPPSEATQRPVSTTFNGWRALAITALLIATAVYHLLAVFLFSSPPDRMAALWFMANSPLLVLWIVLLVRGRINTTWFGIAVEAVLVIIAAALIATGGAIVAISIIVGTACSVFGVVTLLCYLGRPRRHLPKALTETD